jgi:hypothetical protein
MTANGRLLIILCVLCVHAHVHQTGFERALHRGELSASVIQQRRCGKQGKGSPSEDWHGKSNDMQNSLQHSSC